MSKYYFIIIFLKLCLQSFDEIETWFKEIKENTSPDIKLILVGNKCDLNKERIINDNKLKKLTEELEFDLYLETSALTGENVKKLFVEACKILYKEYKSMTELQKKKEEMNKSIIKLGKEEEKEKKFSKKCIC